MLLCGEFGSGRTTRPAMKRSLLFAFGTLASLDVAAANRCFANQTELKSAIGLYIDEDCLNNETCAAGREYGRPIGAWCVGNVTDMSSVFFNKKTFNEDISSWDVSRVTNMRRMFSQAFRFNQSLSDWDVSSVKNFAEMFAGMSDFNADVSTWDVSGATNMRFMFDKAKKFNGDLSKWDVRSVTTMQGMFSGARNFAGGDLSGWDTSKVTNMGRMFKDGWKFNGEVSGWNTKRVTNMNLMFQDATSFNGSISSWDMSAASTGNMFEGALNFNQDLCAWGDAFAYDKASNVFNGSGCAFQETPQVAQRGPFCGASCPVPIETEVPVPTYSPTMEPSKTSPVAIADQTLSGSPMIHFGQLLSLVPFFSWVILV